MRDEITSNSKANTGATPKLFGESEYKFQDCLPAGEGGGWPGGVCLAVYVGLESITSSISFPCKSCSHISCYYSLTHCLSHQHHRHQSTFSNHVHLPKQQVQPSITPQKLLPETKHTRSIGSFSFYRASFSDRIIVESPSHPGPHSLFQVQGNPTHRHHLHPRLILQY